MDQALSYSPLRPDDKGVIIQLITVINLPFVGLQADVGQLHIKWFVRGTWTT